MNVKELNMEFAKKSYVSLKSKFGNVPDIRLDNVPEK